MKAHAPTVLPFPCASSFSSRRELRRDLLRALRASGSPVIVEFSRCGSLNHEDIDLLLECVAQMAARETQLVIVADSLVIRVLLEVTRIASLVPVFSSVEEALAYPQIAAANDGGGPAASESQKVWGA